MPALFVKMVSRQVDRIASIIMVVPDCETKKETKWSDVIELRTHHKRHNILTRARPRTETRTRHAQVGNDISPFHEETATLLSRKDEHLHPNITLCSL
jgi:hypothetical protein